MKKIFKQNQWIITALSIMIAIAGYLNFAGKELPLGKDKVETMSSQEAKVDQNIDTSDISDADISASTKGAKGNQDDAIVSAPVEDEVEEKNENSTEKSKEKIGEAVLTSAENIADYFMAARLNREQTRAKGKEMLLEIINNEKLSEKDKQVAMNQLLTLEKNMEKETQAEQLLGAKGFLNAIVSIGENSVDVIVEKSDMTEVDKAKIEDIVKRKTGCSLEEIVITAVKKS